MSESVGLRSDGSRHRVARARRPPRILAAIAVLALIFLTVAIGSLGTWLVYQPATADTLIYGAFHRAALRDPAHAPEYLAAYRQLAVHTRYNELHYAVHEIAGRVALATGHTGAALVQQQRASHHRPPPGDSARRLAARVIGRVEALVGYPR